MSVEPFVCNANINLDVNRLIDQVWPGKRSAVAKTDQDVGGGRFISLLCGEKLVSMYFHPTKRHSATANGRREVKSVKNAGKWAIAEVDAKTSLLDKINPLNFGPNRTWWNVL